MSRPGWVFYMSAALLGVFVVLGIVWPEQLASGSEQALLFTTSHFGWLYLFVTTGFLVFCVSLAVGRSGRIRLGSDGEAPEFSYPTWLGMIFSAGMGVGLVFWGVAEPMTHYVKPPLGMGPRGEPPSRRSWPCSTRSFIGASISGPTLRWWDSRLPMSGSANSARA